MPFVPSEEEALIQRVVREFARERIGLEAASDLDRHDRFPAKEVAEAAAIGLAGLSLSAEEGGAGAGPAAFALAIDEVAQVCPNTAAVLGSHNGLGLRLLSAAPAPLRARLLPLAAGGEVVVTLATEEAHGSDKSSFGTVARRDGEAYRISGQKAWGLGAAGARHFVVFAQVPEHGPTAFYVPADASGVALGRSEALMGLRASGVRTVYFSDVEVPEGNRLGAEGEALALWRAALPWHQVATAAALNGCVAGALSAAARFAESRVQFGKPIARFQAVSDAIADIDVHLAAARALTLQAASFLDQADQGVWAARAKAFSAATAVAMTRRAIRVQGGTGFMREGGTERFARDARALQFVAEPASVQRETVQAAIIDLPPM